MLFETYSFTSRRCLSWTWKFKLLKKIVVDDDDDLFKARRLAKFITLDLESRLMLMVKHVNSP